MVRSCVSRGCVAVVRFSLLLKLAEVTVTPTFGTNCQFLVSEAVKSAVFPPMHHLIVASMQRLISPNLTILPLFLVIP